MAKHTSKWKNEGAPMTDVGALKYPYKVIHRDNHLTTIASFEDAEAMLDRLVTIHVTEDIMDMFKAGSANWKLKEAFNKIKEHDATAERKEARRLARRESKEDDRAYRVDARLSAEMEEWQERKTTDFRRIQRQLAALSAEVAAIEHQFDEDTYDHLSQIGGRLGTIMGTIKNHHFGVTSSRLFARLRSTYGK